MPNRVAHPPRDPRLVWPVLHLALGIALVVIYLAGVGNLGEPTDIGGGFVVIAGAVLVFRGVVLLAHWNDHRTEAR
jgi:hypothetical protein